MCVVRMYVSMFFYRERARETRGDRAIEIDRDRERWGEIERFRERTIEIQIEMER